MSENTQPVLVRGPDGQTHRFPAGTTPDKIDAAMRQYYSKAEQANNQGGKSVIGGATDVLRRSGFLENIPLIGPQLSKAKPKTQERAVSAGMGVMQGGTFGFADEFAGGDKDTVRFAMQAAREENPKSFMGGEIAGMVMNPATRQAMRAGPAKGAAIEGAVYGAGTAEGGLDKRAQGAAQGAVIAGVAGKAGDVVFDKVAAPLANAAQKLITGRGNTLTKSQRQAQKKLYDAMRADGVKNPRQALEELGRSGVTDGKMVFESFGRNVEDLAVGLGAQGGEAANIITQRLRERQARQLPYIKKRLKSIFKTDDFSQVRTDLGNSFKKIGSPLYKAVTPQPMQMTPELGQLLTRPGMEDVVKQAANNAARKGESLREGTVGFYHNLKLAVDDKVNLEARKNAAREASSGWKSISDGLVEQIEKQAPEYAQARQYWAGAKADEAALEFGQKALRPSVYAEDIANKFTKMSESEKAFFKAGLFRGVRSKVGTTKTKTGDPSSRLRSDEINEKLAVILSPEELKEVNKLFDQVGAQTQSLNLIDTAKGSPTQRRQQAERSLMTPAERVAEKITPEAALDAISSPIRSTQRGARTVTAKGIKRLSSMPEATKKELAQVLSDYPDALKSLPAEIKQVLGLPMQPARRAAGVGFGAGGATYSTEFRF